MSDLKKITSNCISIKKSNLIVHIWVVSFCQSFNTHLSLGPFVCPPTDISPLPLISADKRLTCGFQMPPHELVCMRP